MNNHISLLNTWTKKGSIHPSNWNPYPEVKELRCNIPNRSVENYDSNYTHKSHNSHNFKQLGNEWDKQNTTESFTCGIKCNPNDFSNLNNTWNGNPDPKYIIKKSSGYGVF